MNQQPQPKRRKAIVKRRQQINRANCEIEAILLQDTEQLYAVAPREISDSRQASDDEARATGQIERR